MSELIRNENVVETVVDTKLTQFKGAPVMEGILRSYAIQLQELEDVFFQLLLLKSIEDSSGVQLDGLGAIVGEPRDGRDDDEYRPAIASRVLINKSSPTVEQILAVFNSINSRLYTIQDRGYATFELEISGSSTTMGLAIVKLLQILQEVKAAGVRAKLLYHQASEDDVFAFADGDVWQADTRRGFADDAETTGGYFADIAG